MRWMKYSLIALIATTSVAACDDATGGDDTGRAQIFMSQSANGTSGAVVASYVASSMGILDVSQVDSMYVRVTSVSALRTDADTSESSGGWVTIQLADSGGKRINLMGLPEVGDDSVSLARGDIEAGTYKNIRLAFDSAVSTIILKEDVTVGNFTFEAGTAYALRVPSNLLKIQGETFTVAEDSASAVTLVFDAETSVANVIATGSGRLQISPVIHKR